MGKLKDYRGLDGLERDYWKCMAERGEMKKSCQVHYRRRRNATFLTPEWFHSNTNVYVEERRLSPYWTGHRDMLVKWGYRAALVVALVL
tara:strand:+ start:15907 stop:16173 length:267 start_codon:yes stop_codon:yes gene_type:complete